MSISGCQVPIKEQKLTTKIVTFLILHGKLIAFNDETVLLSPCASTSSVAHQEKKQSNEPQK